MQILFVDDNLDTCALYKFYFDRNNITAQLAHNGLEAVQAVNARSQPFDAIVLDVEMPIMNGWSAFEEIRQLDQGKDVPIAMYTGYDTPEHRARAEALGAACFLIKPLSPDDILECLCTLTEQRKQDSTGS